jgi:hypothetical protein
MISAKRRNGLGWRRQNGLRKKELKLKDRLEELAKQQARPSSCALPSAMYLVLYPHQIGWRVLQGVPQIPDAMFQCLARLLQDHKCRNRQSWISTSLNHGIPLGPQALRPPLSGHQGSNLIDSTMSIVQLTVFLVRREKNLLVLIGDRVSAIVPVIASVTRHVTLLVLAESQPLHSLGGWVCMG